ncbi:MAG: hypothetical protein H7A34_07165 [bacterium]|nr:hypothetical protein [bacterium]
MDLKIASHGRSIDLEVEASRTAAGCILFSMSIAKICISVTFCRFLAIFSADSRYLQKINSSHTNVIRVNPHHNIG